jgi:ribonuclease HII
METRELFSSGSEDYSEDGNTARKKSTKQAPEQAANEQSTRNQEKISEIKLRFMQANMTELPELLKRYEEDHRSGVVTICKQYQAKLEAYHKELNRLETMKQYEKKYQDYAYICGIDEVGRGPLAGPVIACAVILPKDCDILYINDSKQLSEKKREELYDEIIEKAVAFGIGSVPPPQIDEMNILQATYEAMRKAIQNLSVRPDLLLNDAVTIPGIDIRQVPIIKGDAKSISIAAASIVAKVTRDRLMVAYDKVFPGYDFAENKGYGSARHIQAIKELGLTPIHRKSFVRNFI